MHVLIGTGLAFAFHLTPELMLGGVVVAVIAAFVLKEAISSR